MALSPVPAASIAAMIATILVCIGLPLALAIVLKKKYHAKLSFFVGGAICFTLFAYILESIMHQVVLTGPAGIVLQQNILLYALYGGLAAGVFEEVGRFVVLSVLMKKEKQPRNALMFGAGHGGIEAILLVVLTYISNIIFSMMINAGQIDAALQSLDEGSRATLAAQLASLAATAPGMFLLGGAERVLAITLHIALTVLVFTGVRRKRFGYVLLAIALHALVDGVTVLISSVIPAVLVELVVLVMVVLIGAYAIGLYREISKEAE